MTIWNAIAAGGALWCALSAIVLSVAFALSPSHKTNDPIRIGLTLVSCLGFGLCLWGAVS